MVIGLVVSARIVGGYVWIAHHRAAFADSHRMLPDAGDSVRPCTLWFIGSSTIFKWKTLAHDMALFDARDRSVNGAMILDFLRWFGNEPRGQAPALIVWYTGENDIIAGVDSAHAFADFRRFMDAKTRRLGRVPVIALSPKPSQAKPSPARWSNLTQQTVFNDRLRRFAATRADLRFVDIRPLMLRNGRPGPYYVEDGIHLSPRSYARWTAMLRLLLPRARPATTVRRCAPTLSRLG